MPALPRPRALLLVVLAAACLSLPVACSDPGSTPQDSHGPQAGAGGRQSADAGDTQEVADALDRHERWAVKTGADPDAGDVSAAPVTTTVAQLTALPRPDDLPENATSRDAQTTRYGDTEHSLFTIDADIIRWKHEKDDGDFHLVLRDHGAGTGSPTMIAEIPDPEMVSDRSPWRDAMRRTRAGFERRFAPGPRFQRGHIHALVTGVGFFDFLHDQSGLAPNGVELHPVIGVKVLDVEDAPSPRAQADQAPAAQPDQAAQPGAGDVWVNTNSGLYWRPGTRYYGRTRQGEYLSEEEALRQGYRPARGEGNG